MKSYHKLKDEFDQLKEEFQTTKTVMESEKQQVKYWQLKYSDLEKTFNEMEFKVFQFESGSGTPNDRVSPIGNVRPLSVQIQREFDVQVFLCF